MSVTRLPIIIIENALWYIDTTLAQLRRVDNPHEFKDFIDSARIYDWFDQQKIDPDVWMLQEDEPNCEAVVIGVDTDHNVINANPMTGEVWNNGGHFTHDDTFNEIELARIEACLKKNPFFDFHTCTDSPDGSAVIIFNTLGDGTQDVQLCTVPMYERSFGGDFQQASNYAETLGEFVLEALRAYTKTDEGKAKWKELEPKLSR